MPAAQDPSSQPSLQDRETDDRSSPSLITGLDIYQSTTRAESLHKKDEKRTRRGISFLFSSIPRKIEESTEEEEEELSPRRWQPGSHEGTGGQKKKKAEKLI